MNAKQRAGQGLQLAVAVVLSWCVSAAIGLPESFWAVMSALIVLRPHAGATLGAGWDRVRGTVLGTLAGLGGAWLRHHGLGSPPATLAIVAGLAFASAWRPGWRAAPIAALIVLTASGIAGHSALQVAGLRVAEIAIGVATGLLVSIAWPGARASARFDHECAALLRACADELRLLPGGGAGDRREAVRELVILGMAADGERRLPSRRAGPKREAGVHQRTARLVARTLQDAGLVTRLHEALPSRQGDPAWAGCIEVVRAALLEVAGVLEKPGGPMPALDALRGWARQAPQGAGALLVGPTVLLARDLAGLANHAASGDPSRPAAQGFESSSENVWQGARKRRPRPTRKDLS